MTTERLRELMEERVADVSPIDASTAAWSRAQQLHRRRQLGVLGTTAAAVLVVTGAVAVVQNRQAADAPPVGGPTAGPTSPPDSGPSYSPTVETTPDPLPGFPKAEYAGEYRGAPFWWAPPEERLVELPVLKVPGFPAKLSMADEEPVTTPPARVDAVFGTAKEQYRLLSEGRLLSVDLSDRLGPVVDEAGNELNPLGSQSVSPDGTQVFFLQPGRVEVWHLPTNTWRTVRSDDFELAAWTRDGRLWLPGDGDTGRPDPWDRGDHQYSPVVVGPRGVAAELDWTSDVTVPGASEAGRYANPEILVAGSADDPHLLATGIPGICCAIVGWFGPDVLLFAASTASAYLVLAWSVGSPDLYRVSEFTDLPQSLLASSWAEDAFSPAGQ